MASQLEKSSCIVYGMGSLYTSLCPSLILNGVGERISALDDVQKVRKKEKNEKSLKSKSKKQMASVKHWLALLSLHFIAA